MSIRIKVQQSLKYKTCEGLKYTSSPDEKYYEDPVEYVCNDCNGTGKIWKDRSIPISSLKRLLK